MKEFQYTTYKAEYKQQIIELLPYLWGNSNEEALGLFEWKYEKNPFTKEPFCFVVLHKNRVVGFRGYLIQEFLFEEKPYKIAALADTITHPEYRRMGLFESLTNFSIQEISKHSDIVCSYNLSASWPPTGGYLKLGWRPIGPRNNLYYFSAKQFFLSFVLKRKLMPCLNQTKDLNFKKKLFRVEISDQIQAEQVSNLSKFSINTNRFFKNGKSVQYYCWRYGNPSSRYAFAYLWINDCLVGFMALSKASQGFWVIADYLYTNNLYLSVLIKGVKSIINPTILSVWTLSQPNESITLFKQNGFKNINFILKRVKKFNHPPALVRPATIEITPQSWLVNGIDLRNESNWVLYKIDSDAG